MNPDDIEEGDDVYFECKVRANPGAYKVVWKHNVSKIIEKDLLCRNAFVHIVYICTYTVYNFKSAKYDKNRWLIFLIKNNRLIDKIN